MREPLSQIQLIIKYKSNNNKNKYILVITNLIEGLLTSIEDIVGLKVTSYQH